MNKNANAALFDQSLQETSAWDTLWERYFHEYQADLRHAYYIAAIQHRKERSMLEIAAGSFRDMAALNRWGLSCNGVDFSSESVELARKNFPAISGKIEKMDAMRLEYSDGAFDLTYHNGFWVLFDDADIIKLGTEQARVTKSRMVATVHNAHNKPFKKKFEEWSKTDRLYNVRFFLAEEIAALMRRFCGRVTVLPVGGGRVDALINRGYSPGAVRWPFLLRSYAFNRIERFETSERLMCIGEVAQ